MEMPASLVATYNLPVGVYGRGGPIPPGINNPPTVPSPNFLPGLGQQVEDFVVGAAAGMIMPFIGPFLIVFILLVVVLVVVAGSMGVMGGMVLGDNE